MAFYRGRPDLLTTVEWFWVDDATESIPWAHQFGSRVYELDGAEGPEEALGERYTPRPWRGGQKPCPTPAGGLCGTEEQWGNGLTAADAVNATHPGTSVPVCCDGPLVGSCGGLAIGRAGFGACHMQSTYDSYRPFASGIPVVVNQPCQFVEDLFRGRGTSPNNTVAWTHYIDVAEADDVIDGMTRTAMVNTLNYFDGDEVRIPSGGSTIYVVVWVTLCDSEGTTVKRVYLMRS